MASNDPDLDAEYCYLNERFYSRSPAGYFTQRLNGLLVIAGSDPEYGPKLRDGIEALDMSFVISAEERVDSGLDDRELRAFITAESEVVLHHATESMLRVLLAHLKAPPCPWLEITRLRYDRFGKEIDSYFKGSLSRADMERAIASIVLGFDRHQDGFAIPVEEFERAVQCTYSWAAFFAHELGDRAEVYNAAKHGFTVLAEEAYLGFGEEIDKPIFTHSGPSLELLTYDTLEDKTRRWSTTTVWTNPVLSWFLAAVASEMLDSIWRVGRARYMGTPLDGHFAPNFMPVDLQQAAGVGGLRRFRRTVFYETRSPKT